MHLATPTAMPPSREELSTMNIHHGHQHGVQQTLTADGEAQTELGIPVPLSVIIIADLVNFDLPFRLGIVVGLYKPNMSHVLSFPKKDIARYLQHSHLSAENVQFGTVGIGIWCRLGSCVNHSFHTHTQYATYFHRHADSWIHRFRVKYIVTALVSTAPSHNLMLCQ